MKKFRLLTVTSFVLAGALMAATTAHAEGDKKNRLCRHLKMIYLLNHGSNETDTAQVKEKYGELDCGQMSLNLENIGNGRDSNQLGNPIPPMPTITTVTKVPGGDTGGPTTQTTDTVQ